MKSLMLHLCVFQATELLVGNPDFYNLPRKYKISISGCRDWCCYPEINDLSFTPAVRDYEGRKEVGFSIRVGGGLSTDPHFAVRLNAFVKWDQVLPVTKAVSEVFRDAEVLRENRERARLKFLFLQHGWTADTVPCRSWNSALASSLIPRFPSRSRLTFTATTLACSRRNKTGLFYIGAAVLRGRISPATDARCRRSGGTLRLRRTAHHQHSEPCHRECSAQQHSASGLALN